MKETTIIIRDYKPKIDDPYIFASWTRFCWYSAKPKIKANKQEWFASKSHQIKTFLSDGITKIAHLSDDPDTIMGYIVVHEGKVQWMCIKKMFHHQGIDRLLASAVIPYVKIEEEENGKQ